MPSLFEPATIDPGKVLVALNGCLGPQAGISMNELMKRLSDVPARSERQIRKAISELRKQGFRICAMPSTGYYIPRSEEEFELCASFLDARAKHSLYLAAQMRGRKPQAHAHQLSLDLEKRNGE